MCEIIRQIRGELAECIECLGIICPPPSELLCRPNRASLKTILPALYSIELIVTIILASFGKKYSALIAIVWLSAFEILGEIMIIFFASLLIDMARYIMILALSSQKDKLALVMPVVFIIVIVNNMYKIAQIAEIKKAINEKYPGLDHDYDIEMATDDDLKADYSKMHGIILKSAIINHGLAYIVLGITIYVTATSPAN